MLKKIVQSKKRSFHSVDRKNWEKKLDTMLAENSPRVSFKKAISGKQRLSLIAEFKRKSPSKGVLNSETEPLTQAKLYKKGGASALSILTEEEFFNGSLEDIKQVKSEMNLPVLRKDFIFDPLQIKEARAFGADAVLLIAAILNTDELKMLIAEAREYNLDCVCEINNEEEIHKALESGADIIGINNRDLKTFTIDLNTTKSLCSKIPSSIIIISESGIRSNHDARYVQACGANAILVGTELMKAEDPVQKALELIV